MQKTNSPRSQVAEIEKLEALKKRAAKQAAKRELAPVIHPQAECTVLPMGDGKISMGEHIAGLGTAHYEEGETFTVDLPIALNHYERGFVNFERRQGRAGGLEGWPPARGDGRPADRAAYEKLAAQAGG
jgi:hypothetical protein